MTETEEKKRTLGGTIDVDAYCLIVGFMVRDDDDKDDQQSHNDYKRVTVPVTRLPAIFGRDHEVTGNSNFFGIGTLKQFSREHFRIDYWCNDRGRLGQFQSSDAFQWDQSQDSSELMNPDNVDLSKPFFTVTCLGKNGLCVQGQKVEKDKSIVVKNRAAVKASSFCFYFLQSSNPLYRKINIPSHHKTTTIDSDSVDSPPSKRRRGFSGLQAELDLLSTEELLDQLNTAIITNAWERKHQFVGSTLSGRAVMAAAQAPELHEKAAQSGNMLERAEVMDWIAESEQFSKWSQQMLMKLEAKSYQASITNAMVKAGYTRTAEKGRYIKWRLPEPGDNEGTSSVKKGEPQEHGQDTTPTKTVTSNESLAGMKSADAKGSAEALGESDGTLVDKNETGTSLDSSREKQTDDEEGEANSSGEENGKQSGDDASQGPEAE